MYPKFKTIALVKKYGPFLISKMGMKNFKIEFHVHHSKSKILKTAGMRPVHLRGCAFSIGESADVILFYDQLIDRNDALETLVHELLHVRLAPLTELITFNREKSYRKEENLVCRITAFIMETLDFEKLLS